MMTQADAMELRGLLEGLSKEVSVSDADLSVRLDGYAAKLEETELALELTEAAVELTKDKLAGVASGSVTPIEAGGSLLVGLAGLWFARNRTRKKALRPAG